MLRSLILSMAIAGQIIGPVEGQSTGGGTASGVKQAAAIPVPPGAIRLDGVLQEEIWKQAPPTVDFLQKEPVEGAAPTERMEVRFVYDDEALYVGARMYSGDPSAIQAPLGRRDGLESEAEQVFISLDTFHDRRTAYTFGVSASGVRYDAFHGTDQEGGADEGFDPVWQAEARIDAEGWTAEFRIPFTQLRFNNLPEQVWGLNVRRIIPTLEEETYWVVIPRTEQAWASRFGELRGIAGVRPSRRIEILPSLVAGSTMNGNRDRANPFDDGRNFEARAGLDLKMGVGPNLTLNATFNPDFGQVEADPAEVNLTAFATRFEERRPFFTEGAELFSLRHPNVFYSRRIGSPPIGRASGDYVDYPSAARILGAAKLTGRLPSGTSIGVLTAVTGQESAQVYDRESGAIGRVRVAPLSGYGIVRVLREVGTPGSTVGLLIGGVQRQLEEGDPLASLLSRQALVVANDGLLRLRGGEYDLRWVAVASHVVGDKDALDRIQRSSSHYMHRPDRQSRFEYDPTREDLSGLSISTGIDRTRGQHWLFGASFKVDSPTFETNDIANLNGADGIQPRFYLTYRETQPGRFFRGYSLRLDQSDEWNFSRDRQNANLGSTLNVTLLNFWTTAFSYSHEFGGNSSSLTRGGPLMGSPPSWRANARLSNSPAAQTRWTGNLSASGDDLGGSSRDANLSFSFRPRPRWQLSARPSYTRQTVSQQYFSTLPGGRPETFGSRYVFAYIDRTTIATEFRLNFTVRPDLNLDVYAEPFAASGRFYDHGELLAPGSLERIAYGHAGTGTTMEVRPDGSRLVRADGSTFTLPNRDFNVRTFNSNVVLRWEWLPGSTMYLVWQQNRDFRETVDSPVGVGDVFRSVSAPGSNILMFKSSWWLPIR